MQKMRQKERRDYKQNPRELGRESERRKSTEYEERMGGRK